MTTTRTRILLVTESELLAYAMTSSLIDRAEITFVLTPGEALARVSRGERYDLLLCSVPVATALQLHAAIARRNPRLAGRMMVFERRQLRQVIEIASAIGTPERSYQSQIAGTARTCS